MSESSLLAMVGSRGRQHLRDMDSRGDIDVTFDFRSDTPPGRDPDALSPTLRRYHKLLWSKPLPSGAPFVLDDTTRGVYLHMSRGSGSSSSPATRWSRHLRGTCGWSTSPIRSRAKSSTSPIASATRSAG